MSTTNYLTTEDVCSKLKICRQTLYKHTASGRFTSYRLGRKMYYKEDEIEKSLTQMEPVKFINS